jgi:hypothetical protein
VLHVDLNDPQINPKLNKVTNHAALALHAISDHDAYNVPFNLIVEGSYFGDSDCLYQRKCLRESMAEADKESHLLMIKKKVLEELLDTFHDLKQQMMSIAKEKRRYYKRLVSELL